MEHFGVPRGGNCSLMLFSTLSSEVLQALHDAEIEIVIRVPKTDSFKAIEVLQDK